MSFAGMNDRDNSLNPNKNDNINSSYGMSYFQTKETADGKETGENSGSGYTSSTGSRYCPKYPYPEEYADKFREITYDFIKTIRRIQKSCPLLNIECIKKDADDYFERASEITCRAYNIPGLLLPEGTAYGMARSCEKPKDEAYYIMESVFRSRGEAISSLSEQERALLFSDPETRSRYNALITDKKSLLGTLDGLMDTPEESESDEVRNRLNSERSAASRELADAEREYERYCSETSQKVTEIWDKINNYGC